MFSAVQNSKGSKARCSDSFGSYTKELASLTGLSVFNCRFPKRFPKGLFSRTRESLIRFNEAEVLDDSTGSDFEF